MPSATISFGICFDGIFPALRSCPTKKVSTLHFIQHCGCAMKKMTSHYYGLLLLLFSIPLSLFAQFPSQVSNVSLLAGGNLPIMGMGQWFEMTPVIGANLGLPLEDDRRIEIEYCYSHFVNGSIEEKTFFWPVDRKYYSSPDADAHMVMHTFLANFLFPFQRHRLFAKETLSYFSVGSGFYDYTYYVRGLVYPGQSTRPIDLSFHLPAVEERHVALGVNLGIGSELRLSQRMKIDLHLRYNLILGGTRPFEDWGIKEAFPLQMFGVGTGLKYFFNL